MKTLKLVMLALVAGGMLTACGGGEAAQNAEQPREQEQSAEALMEQEKFDNLVASYEDPSRDSWQQPDVLVSMLGDLEGKVVADIGAGSGYFTFRLAESAEKVVAIDIDQRFLDHIEGRKEGEGANNVETRLTTPENPGLKADEADIVLVVNTFHLIDEKVEWLAKLYEGMKENSRLVVVDYKKYGFIPQGPNSDHKFEPEEVEAFMMEAGFEMARSSSEELEYQYIVKTKKGGPAPQAAS